MSRTFDTYDEAKEWADYEEQRIFRERFPNRFCPSAPAPGPIEIESGYLEHDGLIHSEDAILSRPRFRMSSGVYFLIRDDQVVYVGQAVDVHARVSTHGRNWKQFDSYTYIPCEHDRLDEVERHYIRLFQPELNVRGVAA